MPEPKLGRITLTPNGPSGGSVGVTSLTIPKLPVLALMSSVVCMGILFGTKRTLNYALVTECVEFAEMLYDYATTRIS
jgi:hydrogenase/urease accessory protein HupE